MALTLITESLAGVLRHGSGRGGGVARSKGLWEMSGYLFTNRDELIKYCKTQRVSMAQDQMSHYCCAAACMAKCFQRVPESLSLARVSDASRYGSSVMWMTRSTAGVS